MWQKLYSELEDRGFIVIAVAMDSRTEAAEPYIEKAKASYVSLIDKNHLVADLYNMTNVPQAVWIDEDGRIVRPSEVAGFAVSTKFRKIREHYMGAIRDWVENGADSVYSLSADEVRERMPEVSKDIALAHTNFHLGQELWNQGNHDEARKFLEVATTLSPNSWNFFRQMKNLNRSWTASGPAYFKRALTRSFQGERYYPPADMPGMAKILGK